MARAPGFLAAVAFAIGIWLGHAAWRPPLWWLLACLGCVAGAALATKSSRLGYAFACMAMAALGALAMGARQLDTHAPDAALSRFVGGGEVLLTAHVLADSTSRPRGNSTSETVDVQSECIAVIAPVPVLKQAAPETQPLAFSDNGPSIYETMRPTNNALLRHKSESAAKLPCTPVSAGIRVTVYPHDTREDEDDEPGAARKFLYGERLRLVARLRPPRNFGNPGAWDYAGYLRDRDIVALGSARADRVETLPGTSGTRLELWRTRIRRSVVARIAALWPGRVGGLIAAMVIGDRSELRRDIRTDFQRTGIYHILVVSGANVGIIAAIVFWSLRRLRISELTSSALTVLLSCAYALLTDGGAPILRATLTLAVYLGARLLYRERAALNAVGIAGLALLVADPGSLFDASFQLTFVSVLAIAGIAAPLLERGSLQYRRGLFQLDALAYDLTLPPRLAQFRLDLRLLETKLARLLPGHRAGGRGRSAATMIARFMIGGTIRAALNVFDLVTISAVAQFALALPMAVYFHRAVLAGLPANLVAVPLTGVLMPAAAIAVGASYVWTPIARPAAWVAERMLAGILATIRVVGGWRASDWRIGTPDWLAAACVIAVAFCLLAARRRRWIAAAGIAVLAVSAACLVFIAPRRQLYPGKLEITAIDVGQADSTLVITPDGHTLLIDAGGSFGGFQSEFDFGEDVISPYLWSRGIVRLDAVALTHAHSDHFGGMRSVVANFRPNEIWLGPSAPEPMLGDLLDAAAKSGARIVERRTLKSFSFGGAGFRVLSPAAGWRLEDKVRNEDSMVLEIRYGATSALITGDAGRKSESSMLALNPQATLLHVAHNGSLTSTSEEFLDAVQPGFAVISVGARNPFRHPRPEVLNRLAARRVTTYRTDSMGAVSFYLDGARITAVRPLHR